MVPRKQLQRAFTLTELLVVIGIIAVLASLLFPALGKAKESARKTTCVANLHQIAIGIASYAADNQGDWPRYLPDDDAHGHSTASGVWLVSEGPPHWEALGRVYPYLNDKRAFFCPNNRDLSSQFLNYDWNNPPGGTQNMYSSYVLRGCLHTNGEPLGKKLGMIGSRAIVSCGFLYLPSIPTIFPFTNHALVYPVLFGDGHIVQASLPTGIDGKNPPNMWASPTAQVTMWDGFDKAR